MVKNKRVLVIRYGAFGDCLIISPVLKKLKELGNTVIVNTAERGCEIFDHSPYVDKIIPHKTGSVVCRTDILDAHWEKLRKQEKADVVINFTGSIENTLMLHPNDPEYSWSKAERLKQCNVNVYDFTAKWAGLSGCDKLPNITLTADEKAKARSIIQKGKTNILWALTGSSPNKAYPFYLNIWGELLNNHKSVIIYTTGDLRSKMLEYNDERVIPLANDISFREAVAMIPYVDCVVAPDTGLLHASGAFPTPKVGLLGAVTREHVTKYFKNDFSIESASPCSPCFHLVYNHILQCPIDPVTKGAWCMACGIDPKDVYEQIKKAITCKRA